MISVLLRLAQPATAAFGVDGRELTVLAVLALAPVSQQEAAAELGIDRTTMVALIDSLEANGLVARHRSPQDRRRNIVELTASGTKCLEGAGRAREQAEHEFLAPLGDELRRPFIKALQILARAAEPSRAAPR